MTEIETLREALREARSMLNTVATCGSHYRETNCEDCREYAGIHRDRIDEVLRKPVLDPNHVPVTEVVDGAGF